MFPNGAFESILAFLFLRLPCLHIVQTLYAHPFILESKIYDHRYVSDVSVGSVRPDSLSWNLSQAPSPCGPWPFTHQGFCVLLGSAHKHGWVNDDVHKVIHLKDIAYLCWGGAWVECSASSRVLELAPHRRPSINLLFLINHSYNLKVTSRLQEVIAPGQELTPCKTAICHLYTPLFVHVKKNMI